MMIPPATLPQVTCTFVNDIWKVRKFNSQYFARQGNKKKNKNSWYFTPGIWGLLRNKLHFMLLLYKFELHIHFNTSILAVHLRTSLPQCPSLIHSSANFCYPNLICFVNRKWWWYKVMGPTISRRGKHLLYVYQPQQEGMNFKFEFFYEWNELNQACFHSLSAFKIKLINLMLIFRAFV